MDMYKYQNIRKIKDCFFPETEALSSLRCDKLLLTY
jgi:hypothetical protein